MDNLAIGQYEPDRYFQYAYKTKYTHLTSDSILGSIVVGVLEPAGNTTGSGILLSEDIVLSATHVVNSDKFTKGTKIYSFGIGYVPGTVEAADAVATQASSIISLRNYTGYQTNDITAIRLDAPVAVDKNKLLGITSCYGSSKKLTETLKSMFSVGFPGLYTVADDQLTPSGKVDSYALSSGANIAEQPSELESLDVSSARYDGQMNWKASGVIGAAGHSGGPAIVDVGGRQFVAGNFTWANATGPDNGPNNNGAGVGGILLSDKDYATLSAAIAKTGGTLPRLKLAWADDPTNLILGSDKAGGDKIDTVWRSELVFAGDGNDTIIGSSGNDAIDGGIGTDTVDYRGMSVKLIGGTSNDGAGVHIAKGADGLYGTDTLHDVENAVIGKQTLKLGAAAGYDQSAKSEKVAFSFQTGLAVEHDVAAATSNDATPVATLDLSEFGKDTGVVWKNGALGGTNWTFIGLDILIGSAGNDTIVDFDGLSRIDTGTGDDIITNTKTAAVIDGGAGDDTFDNIATGSIISTGSGKDKVGISTKQVLVTDATADDRLYANGGMKLTGGTRLSSSEDAYAYGSNHTVKYGYDKAGELVVTDRLGNQVFIADGASTGFGSDAAFRAFGLYVFEMTWTSHLLRDMQTAWNVEASYETILGHYLKAMTGFSGWKGVDPLVLDLDGDGVTLSGQSSVSPRFDTDGDGFAEKTGWVGAQDGLLALDRNGNGVIDDVSELFGGPRAGGGMDLDGDGTISFAERMQSGFEALGIYDDNGDGRIDASDGVFSQLRVWVDANGDAITDAGELKTLDEVGIASISLAATAQAATFVAGNQVTDVGHFTRTDGTTAEVDNVALKLDNFDSVWLKQAAVTTAAAALPELRGHGTLADLRQVLMVEDARSDGLAPLHATLAAATPALVAARGLDALRDAATPVLRAWSAALPTASFAGTYSNVHVVLGTGEKSRAVVDYAYARKDSAGIEHWVLASRGDPTRADDPASFEALVAAHSELDGRWRTLDPADFSFIERYVGENLPTVLDAGDAWSAMVATFDTALTYLDMLSVRLAVQVAPAFYGLSYDREQDIFHPATVRQLVPFFESVFEEVKTADADAIADRFALMKPVFDRIISAYDRETGNSINSYGFVYSNIVAAWENVGLPISLKTAAVDFGIPADMIVEGTDAIDGTRGDELFYLGAGNQTVTGHDGHDNYVIGRNFGHDTIIDVEPFGSDQSEDYLRFAQTASTDIRADIDGIDLVLTQISTGDTVRVVNEFIGKLPGVFGVGNTNDECGVTLIQFADGVTWTKEDVAWKASHPAATSDVVMGTPDMDVLDGGAGDDTLIGGNDFDIYVFDRGHGHDSISEQVGWAGFAINNIDQDAIVFGAGIGFDDIVFHRDGGSSDLVLSILGSDDSLTIRGEFESTYTGVFGQIWLERIEVMQFVDDGQLGWDEIRARTIASQVTDGNDAVYGFDTADVLDGGAGDDTLVGGNEVDTYLFGYGSGRDVIDDEMGNILASDGDRLSFAAGIAYQDVTFGHPDFGTDLVATLADGSSVTLRGEFDVTYTGVFGDIAFNRIEYFDFTADDGTTTEVGYRDIERDLLLRASTSGDDRIFGFDQADTIDGGAGDDFMAGASGADTYVFGHGSGHDRIQDESANPFAPDGDTVIMTSDVTPDQVRVTRSGEFDLVLTLADSGDSVTLIGQVDNNTLGWWPTEIETVAFAGGTTWVPADLRRIALEQATTAGDDTIAGFKSSDGIFGGAGSDTMRGGGGNDTLVGGTGDDLLVGDDGDDTFLWARGDGNDTVSDDWWVSSDQVVLDGVGSDAVTLRRSGDTIQAVIGESAPGAGDGGSVSFAGNPSLYGRDGIDSLVFADGSVWTIDEMRQNLLDLATTSGNDEIIGFDTFGEMSGGGGNDTLFGMGGADTLIGSEGDDHLMGGDGDDTYVWARGDGNDLVAEGMWGGVDRIVLQDVATSDVSAKIVDGHVVLTIADSSAGAGGSMVFDPVAEDEWGHSGVEQLVFADGTIWRMPEIAALVINGATGAGNDSITGTDASDTLIGGAGDDTLAGGGGDDRYVWARGDGNDFVTEGMWGGVDRIVLQGVSTNEVSAKLSSGHVVLTIADSIPGVADGGSMTFDPSDEWEWGHPGLEQIEFADGTVWRIQEIANLVVTDQATSGNDVITGTGAGERIVGGAGDDTLAGGGGDDTYVWARGDGNDLVSEGMWGGVDRIVLQGISTNEVSATIADGHVVLTIADSIPGAADGGSMTFDPSDEWEWGHPGLEQIEFADGTVWRIQEIANLVVTDQATSGNDVITGTGAGERIVGGAGDDTLAGGGGDDTYVWARGDGNDLVSEGMWGGVDRIVLQGVSTNEVSAKLSSGHVVLTIADSIPGAADGGSMTFDPSDEWEWGHPGLEQIEFADGTVWRIQEIANLVVTDQATSGNDVITGTGAGERIVGGAGDDTLAGGGGDDTYVWARGDGNDLVSEGMWGGFDRIVLQGVSTNEVSAKVVDGHVVLTFAASSAGGGDGGSVTFDVGDPNAWGYSGVEQVVFDDGTVWQLPEIAELLAKGASVSVTGTVDADTLAGGAGNDTLAGDAGSDTYVWARGDGSDTVVDWWNADDVDVLALGGVDLQQLDFARGGANNADLLVTDTVTGEVVTVQGQFYTGSGTGVESVVVGATTLDATAIASSAWYRGGSGGDGFWGGDLGERFDGRAGDDTLFGGGGSDTFLYRVGDGNDLIGDYGAASDVDRLVLTNLNRSDVTVTRAADDLWSAEIHVGSTGEILRLDHQFVGADYGIEAVDFSDGTSMTAADLTLAAPFEGTAAADYLYGADVGETYNGRLGNDVLVGGAGDDVYRYASGDGNDVIDDGDGAADRLVFADLTASDVRLLIVGDDLHLDVLGTGETITDVGHFTSATRGLDQIAFSGGTTWSRADIASYAVAA